MPVDPTGAHFAYSSRWSELGTDLPDDVVRTLDDRDFELEHHITLLDGVWQTWVPADSGFTLGNGTINAEYRIVGRTMEWRVHFTLGSTSAIGTNPKFAVPGGYELDNADANPHLGYAIAFDATASAPNDYWAGVCFASDSTETVLTTRIVFDNATVTATAPFTWTTSDQLWVQGMATLKQTTRT